MDDVTEESVLKSNDWCKEWTSDPYKTLDDWVLSRKIMFRVMMGAIERIAPEKAQESPEEDDSLTYYPDY